MTAFATRTTLLTAALGLLLAGPGNAQTPTSKSSAAEKELAAARAELDRAARRVAELSSRQIGRERQVRVDRVMTRAPVLGVILAPDPEAGVRIVGVTPDSAASKAGLRANDRIVTINNVRILGDSGDLRVTNARKLLGDLDDKSATKLGYERAGRNAVVSVTPEQGRRVIVVPRFDRAQLDQLKSMGDMGDIDVGMDIDMDIDEEAIEMQALNIAPEIRKEIIRMGPGSVCKDGRCKPIVVKTPTLVSAFRWNGLNLASVDPQLGRYFGTDNGVLVLSSGELDGLQAGDVIQKIDGKAVSNPREAMDILRDKPADARVTMSYLRDRKSASAQIKVPNVWNFPSPPRPPMPPAPPAPPRPPTPMQGMAPKSPPPPPPPPRAPAPPAPPSTANVPAPPAPPPFAGNVDYVYMTTEDPTTAYSWSADDAEPNVVYEVKDVEIKTR